MLLFITFWFWQCHLLLNPPLNMADHFSQRLQRAFKGKYECTGIPGALLYKERENFHKIRRTNTEKTSGLFWQPRRDAWGSLFFYETRRTKRKIFRDRAKNVQDGMGQNIALGKWVFHQRKTFSFSNGIFLINMFLHLNTNQIQGYYFHYLKWVMFLAKNGSYFTLPCEWEGGWFAVTDKPLEWKG